MNSAHLPIHICLALLSTLSCAEITTDGSLGAATTLTGPDFAIVADLGQQRGSHLFHSYSQFNVARGESATMSGSGAIAYILQRVSGGNISAIDGTWRSTVDGANVILMNPAGALFGPNTSLDISGSIHITSADYLRMNDAARFAATPLEAETLSSAAPAAFGFLGSSAGSIELQGAILTRTSESTLTLSGNGITFSEAEVQIDHGNVFLASIGGAGEFNIADGSLTAATLADITMTQSRIDVGGEGAGVINMVGGDITFNASSLRSITEGDLDGGDISISADALNFAIGSSIIAGTAIGSTGDSTDVILSAANSIQMANPTISLGSLGLGQAGTLTLDAPIITGSLSSSEEIIFSSASDTSASINLSGTGAITKVGSNVLTLSGTNTYTGNTTVSGGSLLVNGSLGNTAVTVQSGALLGGSGTLGGSVTVENGGIISPGNSPGILTVTGDLNLNSGSTTQMEINGTTPGTEYDQIVVGGTATLGGTLNLYFSNGLTHDDSFILIDAATISGDFDSVVNVLNNALTFQTSITDDYILTLTAVQTDFAPFALTPNQLAVANAIDDESLSGNVNNLIGRLNSLPGSSLPDAFDQIAPTPFAFLPSTAFANTRAQQRALSNHMGQRRSGLHSQTQSPASTSAFKVKKVMVSSSGMTRTPEENRWGLYTGGNFGRFDLNSGRNGVGYDSDSFGSSVGVDYQISDSLILGFYTAYQDNDLDFGGNGGDVQSDATTFGLYGSWFNEEGCWVEGSVGAGYHSYDTTRRVLGANATGDTTANEFQISMSTGRDLSFGDSGEWTLTPSFGLAYDHLRTDGFTETGSLAPLTMDAQTNSSLQSQTELRLSYEREWNSVQWLPYVSTGWRHEYLDRSQSVDARFASGGDIFSVQGPSSPRDSITFGTGVNAILSESLSAGIGYNSELNSSFSVHQVDASLNFKF